MPHIVYFTAIPVAAVAVVALILLALLCCCRKRYAICMPKSTPLNSMEPTATYINVTCSVPKGSTTHVQPPAYTELPNRSHTYSEIDFDDKDSETARPSVWSVRDCQGSIKRDELQQHLTKTTFIFSEASPWNYLTENILHILLDVCMCVSSTWLRCTVSMCTVVFRVWSRMVIDLVY